MKRYQLTCNCCKIHFESDNKRDQLCKNCEEYFKGITLGCSEIIRNEEATRKKQTKELINLTAERDALKSQLAVMSGAFSTHLKKTKNLTGRCGGIRESCHGLDCGGKTCINLHISKAQERIGGVE